MRSQQLTKFQTQVDSAMMGYLSLLKRKELLAVSIEQYSSLSGLSSNVRDSILTIQNTLYASLMIEIHAWLFDKSNNSSNQSLNGLLKTLTDNKTNTKHLEKYFTTPPKTVNLNHTNKKWHKHFVSDYEVKFNTHFKECTIQIENLLNSEEAKRVASLRDKLLVHKDGQYDLKSNGHVICDVFYLIDNMKIILVSLTTLMTRTAYPIAESEQLAKVMANDFWEHVAPKTSHT